MISRYSRPEMASIWSDFSKFATWLDVELAVTKVLEKDRKVPRGTAAKIRTKAKINVARILEIEKTVKHDVIAFTTSIAEQVGPPGRYFHFGLTSSDIVDTALSLLLKRSADVLLEDLEKLEKVLIQLAKRHKALVGIGRTHGIHAEPTSFGLKFLGWLVEFRRHKTRLLEAQKEISFGKFSGAVGSYGALDPSVEARALKDLGLKVEPVATQVVPRDRHFVYFNVLAGIGSSIERVAVELRHLQRTEVQEIEEEFSFGQKGSSAMPHKKNPISAENLTGCARIMRSYAHAAQENVALWHERDISHSSVERIIGPDATILLNYMLNRLTGVLKNLHVRKESVKANLDKTQGIYFSGHVLLELVEKGLTRERAYSIVQKAAHTAWSEGSWFGDELQKNPEFREKISAKQLTKILNLKRYLAHVDTMYKRVLGTGGR